MPTQRISLFGSIESRDYKSFFDGITADSAIKYDQGGTDVQYDVLPDPITGKRIGYFYPRENFATSGVPASTGAGTAIRCWNGSSNAIVTAFGATNSELYKAGTTQGTITGQAAFITEGTISDVANLFVVNTAGTKGYFGTGGGSLTEITDAQYPANNSLVTTGPIVQMDGFAFVMTTVGQLWNSDDNSISLWTPAAYTSVQQKPDAGVGIARYQNSIVAFGSTSTEFFFNAGNQTNSPLSPEANYINLGCANQYAFCNIGDSLAWFSTNQGYGIYIMDGRGPKKISTEPIDRILAGSTASAVRLNPFVSHGKMFLLITAPVAPGQLAYDVASGTWELWWFTGNQVTQSDIVPSSASASSVYVGPSVTSYYATSATGRTGTFLTAKFDAGTNKRKFLSRIGVLAAMGSTAATTVSVSWSDDDYETFSTDRTVSINATEGANLYRCGAFNARAFKVSVANDSSGRIARVAALELEYEIGTN